jgi:hypothetical protein
MVDRAMLHEALRHVDQASLVLSTHPTEHELAVARAELGELRALLSAAALQDAVSDGGSADGAPVLPALEHPAVLVLRSSGDGR